MRTESLPDGRPEVSPPAVADALGALWARPVEAPARIDVAEDRVDELTRATIDAMLTRRFRIGKKPSGEEYDLIYERVRRYVSRGRPVQVTLGYGPMKNPNTTRESRADWADFFALTNLCRWYNKVHEVYPPSLRVKLLFDDSTARMVLRAPRRRINSYISSMCRLVRMLGYGSVIIGTMRQSTFAWLFHLGFYQWARRRVRHWDQDPENQPLIDKMVEYARRNLTVPFGLDDEDRERLYREAGHRFRVYWEALALSGLSRFNTRLIAMYLDGTQHHRPQRGALHLHSLGGGQMTQPWQGEGALMDNGHGKLVPFALTGARRDRMATHEVGGLSLVPLEGFERIEVCWESRRSTAEPDRKGDTGRQAA
jgi:hypothetical protein